MKSKLSKLAIVTVICAYRWWFANSHVDWHVTQELLKDVNTSGVGYNYLPIHASLNILLFLILFKQPQLVQLAIRKRRADIVNEFGGQAVLNSLLFSAVIVTVNIGFNIVHFGWSNLVEFHFFLVTLLYAFGLWLFYLLVGLTYLNMLALLSNQFLAVFATFLLGLILAFLQMILNLPTPLLLVTSYERFYSVAGLDLLADSLRNLSALIFAALLFSLLRFIYQRKDILNESN